MRLNRYIASSSLLSRRSADQAICDGRVQVNNQQATPTTVVNDNDRVTLDGKVLIPSTQKITILLNKPIGYVVSKDGQGSRTIYDLIPHNLRNLNPVGRLDKYSSGLLLLTNDGQLAQQLTHPSYGKSKVYLVTLDKPLAPLHQQMIADIGIQLHDGPSRLIIDKLNDSGTKLQITMSEGRNRQIRRTFEALDYKVSSLHRISFGSYQLPHTLAIGSWKPVA